VLGEIYLVKEKQKLTLSVDKEVVEKAKKLSINISEITERVLAGYTSAERPEGSIYDAYKQLFDSILPLLKEFDCDVKVAEGTDMVTSTDSNGKSSDFEMDIDIYLYPDGTFYADQYDSSFRDVERIERSFFLSPNQILSNLVEALAKSKERREEQMQEILMAKRIIDAMSATLLKKQSAKKA